MELSERLGFPVWARRSKVSRALALACSRGEDTLAEATEGLAGAAGTGNEFSGAPGLLWMVARIHQQRGSDAEALDTVLTALGTSARLKQPFCDAELLRLKGEVLLPKDEVESEV